MKKHLSPAIDLRRETMGETEQQRISSRQWTRRKMLNLVHSLKWAGSALKRQHR